LTFFSVSCQISGPTVFVSHFPRFSVFSTYSRSYSVHFSFFTVFSVSCHIWGPTEYVSYFPRFSVFFFFFCHIPDRTMWTSYFSRFSVFIAIFQVLQFLCFIFDDFHFFSYIRRPTECFSHFAILMYFSRYSRSYHMSFSFSLLVSFLAIFQVLQCVFLIFHFFQCFSPYFAFYCVCVSFSTFIQFSRHNTGPTLSISHFSHFWVFLAMF